MDKNSKKRIVYKRATDKFIDKVQSLLGSIINVPENYRKVLLDYYNLSEEVMKLKLGYDKTSEIVKLYLSKNIENTMIANEIMKYYLKENEYNKNSAEALTKI